RVDNTEQKSETVEDNSDEFSVQKAKELGITCNVKIIPEHKNVARIILLDLKKEDTCKCTESVVEETVKNDEKPEENDVQKDEEKDVQKHEEKDIPKNEEPKPENVSQSLQS